MKTKFVHYFGDGHKKRQRKCEVLFPFVAQRKELSLSLSIIKAHVSTCLRVRVRMWRERAKEGSAALHPLAWVYVFLWTTSVRRHWKRRMASKNTIICNSQQGWMTLDHPFVQWGQIMGETTNHCFDRFRLLSIGINHAAEYLRTWSTCRTESDWDLFLISVEFVSIPFIFCRL